MSVGKNRSYIVLIDLYSHHLFIFFIIFLLYLKETHCIQLIPPFIDCILHS